MRIATQFCREAVSAVELLLRMQQPAAPCAGRLQACFHPNGLCVLGLLATHPLFRKAAAIGEEHLQIKVQYSEVCLQGHTVP